MKTMVIEARYSSDIGQQEKHSGLVDGINDIVLGIAKRFSLDILSLSHVVESDRSTSITCTAVCSLNGHTLKEIADILSAENHKEEKENNLYCFHDAFKLSVRANEINYN